MLLFSHCCFHLNAIPLSNQSDTSIHVQTTRPFTNTPTHKRSSLRVRAIQYLPDHFNVGVMCTFFIIAPPRAVTMLFPNPYITVPTEGSDVKLGIREDEVKDIALRGSNKSLGALPSHYAPHRYRKSASGQCWSFRHTTYISFCLGLCLTYFCLPGSSNSHFSPSLKTERDVCHEW